MGAGSANIRAGGAYVELVLKDSAYTRGLKQAEAQLAAFGKKLSSIGSSMQNAGGKMLFGGGLAAAPLGLSAKIFMGFEDGMKAVQAVTGATGAQFDMLNAKAKELGRTTSFTAAQVAAGMLSLGRAGFNPAEIDAAIAGMLNLSRATGTELGQSADIAAGTLRAFNLQAGEMSRVADVLVATANNSAQTLEDLGESMSYVAPIAQEYGLSLEDTSKALGVLANMSIKGSMAGTSLRQIMLQLADPAVQTKLKGMGINAVDAAGNLRPLGDVMTEVGTAMAGMGSAQRLALGKELFDQRAAGAAMKLAKTNFPALSKAIDNAGGVAAKTAATMDSGLGGAWRMLTSGAEGVAIAIGEALAPELGSIGRTLADLSQLVTHFVNTHKEAIVTFGKWAVAIAAAGAALWGLGAAVKLVGFGFSGLASLARVATMGFGLVLGAGKLLLGLMLALASPIGLVGAAIGGLVGYAAYASGAFQNLAANAGTAWSGIKQTATDTLAGIREAMAAGDMALAAEIAWAGVKVAWQTGLNWLYAGWLDFKGFFQRVWTEAVYKVASIGTTAWAGMKAGWVLVSSFFQQVWSAAVNGIKSTWGSAQNWIGKAWIKAMKGLGVYDEQTAAGALAILDEEHAKLGDNRAAERQAIEEDKQQRLSEIGQQEADSLAALDSAKAAEHANITAANNAALDASKDDLAAKKKALADLTGKSKTAAEEKRKKDEEEAKKTAATQGAAGAAAAQQVANAAKGAMVGTFNAGLAAMLVGVGMSGAAKPPSAFGQPGAPASVLTGGAGGIGVPKAAADQNSTLTPEAEKAAKENAKAKGLFGPGTQSAEEQLRQRRQAAIEAAMAEDPSLTITGGAGGIGVPTAAGINQAAAAAPAAIAQAAAAASPAGGGDLAVIAANTANTVTKLEAIRLLLERGGGGSQPRYRR